MKNIHIIPTDKPSRLFMDDKTTNIYLSLENNLFKNGLNIYITSDEQAKTGDYGYIPFEGGTVKLVGKYFADDWKKIILTTDQDLIKDGVQAIGDGFLEWFVKNPSCEKVEVEHTYISFELNKPTSKYYKIIIPKEELKPIHEQIIDLCGGEEQFKEIAGLKPKQEIKLEDIFNYEKKRGVRDLIDAQKQYFYCSDRLELDENERCVTQCEHCAVIQPKYTIGCDPYDKQETLEEASWKHNPLKKLDGEFLRAAFIAGAKWQQEQDQYVYLNGYIDGSRSQAKFMYNEEDLKEAYKYSRIWDMTSFEDWFEQFKNK